MTMRHLATGSLSWGILLLTSWIAAPALGAPPATDFKIWQVQSAQNTVYLMGSIHVGKNCTLNSPNLDTALGDAEQVVFEIDYQQLTPQRQLELAQQMILQSRLRPGDRGLSELFDAATLAKLAANFNALKPATVPLSFEELAQNYKPGFIVLQMMTLGGVGEQTTLKPSCGVDVLVAQRAIAAQKNILALETIEQQMSLLNRLFEELPDNELRAMFIPLLQKQSNAQGVQTLLAKVSTGDFEGLSQEITESCKPTPIFCHGLFTQRNHNWLGQIQQYLQVEDDYLVVVGAGHLVGPEGVLELLKKQGYTPVPINQTP
jgi:hypothetical protein